jgi:hypothetical protein
LEAIPTTHTIDEIKPIYRNLKRKHGKIALHVLDDNKDIEVNKQFDNSPSFKLLSKRRK